MKMKKTLLLIAVVIATTISAAQAQNFYFGPKFGLNVSGTGAFEIPSSFSDSEGHKMGSKPGLVVGAFAEYKTKGVLGVALEVLYSQQGSEIDIKEGILGGPMLSRNYNMNLNYITVPILLKVYPVKGLSINAGIQPGFLVASKLKAEIEGENETGDLKNYTNSVDFSIPVGISYAFKFGLVLDARYNIGVTNLFKNDDKGNKVKGTNGVFALTVGWRF